MRHKHADIAREWMEDTSRVVESRPHSAYAWINDRHPAWNEAMEYRFKPKPDVEVDARIFENNGHLIFGGGSANCVVTFDGETGKPKSLRAI